MKRRDITKSFAQRSGFVMWATEEHGPGQAGVDWSSNYDNELQLFLEMVVKQCVELSDPHTRIRILDYFKMSR